MAHTRAQSAAQSQRGRVSSAPEDRGNRPWRIQKPRSSQTARPQGRQIPKRIECVQPHSYPKKKSLSRQCLVTTGKRGTKRSIDVLNQELDSVHKRPRRSPRFTLIKQTLSNPVNSHGDTYEPLDPIRFWAREGKWPREYFESKTEHLLAWKPMPSHSRKRSNAGTSSTPSDQRPREEKSAPYQDPRYEALLGTRGSFMVKSSLDILSSSKALSKTLLEAHQAVPTDSLFRDDIFETTCQKIHNRNEARVIQDISRLIVPSAESLATFGAEHLDILIESVNEGWNNSIPLTGTRPQPDYSLGFKREAFSDDQLAKLSPFIGDFISGDKSFFMATYYIYFPFLTCEVKCGAAALDVADRQNAHSMTLAVRGVTELFRAVKREDEVHRQILAFSISHDYGSVRIYGYYPVLEGKDIKYYRHPIRKFDFTELNGREKWTAYQFTKNVYELWMPSHFERICSAIDQLPSDLDFDDPSLPATELSQGLQSHHLSQSDADFISPLVEQDGQSSVGQQIVTPNTSVTNPGMAKKRKGKK